MPLRGTSVIHPSMQTHHAPVAEGGMTATVDIFDPDLPGTSSYDRESGQTITVPAPPVYAGFPARVQALSRGEGEGVADAVGQDVVSPPYLVAVPASVTAQEGWVVVVTDCPDDRVLVGRRLTVRRVSYATARFQRDLYCDDE